jgi:hypothetical protein
MAKRLEAINPFYIVLVVVGILFALTACAYGVMALRAVAVRSGEASASGQSLMQFLDRYGMWVMIGELAVLALATFGAIGTDDYWTRRAQQRNSSNSPSKKP